MQNVKTVREFLELYYKEDRKHKNDSDPYYDGYWDYVVSGYEKDFKEEGKTGISRHSSNVGKSTYFDGEKVWTVSGNRFDNTYRENILTGKT